MKIAITMGDPSGIGPEIVAATLNEVSCENLVVFGDEGVLARAGLRVPVEIRAVTALTPDEAPPGRPTPEGARAQVAYLEAAVESSPEVCDALVTAPISKKQVQSVGFGFPGHTEFLAARYRAAEHAMLFVGPTLRVVLATIHVPLARVPEILSPDHIARAVFLGGKALKERLGFSRPRTIKIGVLGLNPHAGEDGLFGDEEARIVSPGIAAGRARLSEAGVDATVDGPLVPDAAYRKPYDLFVALYHDQGLIPLKVVDFDLAVNVTLGLPIVRTSPDHGVAYDIAGRGIARAESFAAALRLAEKMSRPMIR